MSTQTVSGEEAGLRLPNRETQLRFADQHIDARWVQYVRELRIPKGEPTIVVNTGSDPAVVAGPREGVGPQRSWILPYRSVILDDTVITSGSSLVLLRITSARDLGSIVSKAWFEAQDSQIPWDSRWHHTSECFPGYPKGTPLWRSPQDSINLVSIDPVALASQGTLSGPARQFQVKVNLWYSPEHTDCRIHNQHDFLEIHTQVYGTGRMQKFHTDQELALYEDVILSPGRTHDPFMEVSPTGAFIYPWHRYYSDTDCIWMAIELHPLD